MFLKWTRRMEPTGEYLSVSLAESHRVAGQKSPRQRIITYLGGGHTSSLTNPDPEYDRDRARFWTSVQLRVERGAEGVTADDWLRYCREIVRKVPLPAGWSIAEP